MKQEIDEDRAEWKSLEGRIYLEFVVCAVHGRLRLLQLRALELHM